VIDVQRGVVALLDALGVKGIWTTARPQEVTTIRFFKQSIEKAKAEWPEVDFTGSRLF